MLKFILGPTDRHNMTEPMGLRPMTLDLLPETLGRVAPAEVVVAPDQMLPSGSKAQTSLPDGACIAMLDALPVAVYLIDSDANVLFANRRTAEMIGIDQIQALGRNVLDFVLVDDLDFAADLLNDRSDFSGRILGPCRVRYIDAAGQAFWTQVWANEAPPELGVGRYLVTMSCESVRDVLATAVNSVAADDDLDSTLASIALSGRAMPLCGRGAVLVVEPAIGDDQQRFRVVGDWPLDHEVANAHGTPWQRALADATDADVDVLAAAGLPQAAEDHLLDEGIRSIWVRAIVNSARRVVGVYVVFPRDTGAASSNQDDHLREAVRLAALGFEQSERRAEHRAADH